MVPVVQDPSSSCLTPGFLLLSISGVATDGDRGLGEPGGGFG
jgi:hypothetical protein